MGDGNILVDKGLLSLDVHCVFGCEWMHPETRRGVGGISLGEHVVVILGML